MYLFDTDVLSWLGRRVPPPGLRERIEAVAPELRHAASMTVAELLFGALARGEQGRPIVDRIEQLILPGLSILPFDEPAARRFARIKADLQLIGQPVGDADLQIASVALVHGLTLVTGNLRHFARVPGLATENWLA